MINPYETAKQIETLQSLIPENAQLKKLVAELEKTASKLVTFFETGMRTSWDGHDWEGGEIQDLAEELGLIQRASDEDQDEEYEVFYDYSPEIKNLMDDKAEVTDEI